MKLGRICFITISVAVLFFLTQCCTSKEQVEDAKLALKRTNYPPPSLSPGTAEVTATILKLIKENSKTVGLFRIDTVHAYGPSTRPIGVGSQLNIEFNTNIFGSEEESEILEIFQPETKHKLTIGSSLTAFKRDQTPPWQIISIK